MDRSAPFRAVPAAWNGNSLRQTKSYIWIPLSFQRSKSSLSTPLIVASPGRDPDQLGRRPLPAGLPLERGNFGTLERRPDEPLLQEITMCASAVAITPFVAHRSLQDPDSLRVIGVTLPELQFNPPAWIVVATDATATMRVEVVESVVGATSSSEAGGRP
jgi:hypothetical protein